MEKFTTYTESIPPKAHTSIFIHTTAGELIRVKLPAMLTFLQDMQHPDKLHAFPLWKAYQLGGKREGVWSLHVTRNWRLTFHVNDGEIREVNYEDYH